MQFTLFYNWVKNIKCYIVRILQEDPVRFRSLIRHFAGVVICYKLYGASIADYFEMRFFEKKHSERKTFFTTYPAKRFIRHIDGAENIYKFRDKIYMYQVIGPFTKREQLICPPDNYQEFENYVRKHKTIIYKPNRNSLGTGIEAWSVDDSDISKLYARALEQPAVLDELVIQHPDIARLNPGSVNTVKIYTFMIEEKCHFIAAEFRMGRSDLIVDNIESGGLAAGVDIETGAIVGTAYDLQMNPYIVHPDTGIKITGFVLPNWDEVLRFTEECAKACPFAYVEWDIAIREKDCVVIEANLNARNCGIQMGVFHGRKEQFQELEKLYDLSIS